MKRHPTYQSLLNRGCSKRGKIFIGVVLGWIVLAIVFNTVLPNNQDKAEFPAQTNCNAVCEANGNAYLQGYKFAKDYGYCPSIKEVATTGENRAWLKGCRSYGS